VVLPGRSGIDRGNDAEARLAGQRSGIDLRNEMPHTSEIEKALDDLIIDEAGMKFQVLAVVLAKQKWPRLIACERKKYLGLDAYASRELEPDGNGFGLACSLTPEYEKIAADATKVKKNFPDVRVLAFATAGKVSNYRAKCLRDRSSGGRGCSPDW